MSEDRIEKMTRELAEASPTDLREVAHELHKMIGGAAEIADMLLTDLKAAPMGSMYRQKIMGMIVDTLKFASSKDDVKENMHLLSEDDLIRQARKLTQKYHDESAKPEAT